MSAPFPFSADKFKDEALCVQDLLQTLIWSESLSTRVTSRSISLIDAVRSTKYKPGMLEGFLQQYPLTSEEGRALMSLAEAYLRIPDAATRNALIRDKLSSAAWARGDNHAADWFTRLAGVGLLASKGTLNSLLAKLGEPLIRSGVERAMKMMGQQFVLGETIQKALAAAANNKVEDYSFDMLGEGARTFADAEKYFESYAAAIEAIGSANLPKPAGISVKLSALYPRYSALQQEACFPALCERMRHLCALAAERNIALTIDAEEADRLELSLEIFEQILRASPPHWEKLGIAVQAYSKRSRGVITHLATLAESAGRKIRVRLVKGAYWDTEIKHAQLHGLCDFSVYTKKSHTDVSYLACAQKMLQHNQVIYPMFATHNAHTIAAISEMAAQHKPNARFEFQRLHGMGECLYKAVQDQDPRTVTVYAPVGAHQNLLPYLVRRLLENGANSSFISHLNDPDVPAADLSADPVEKLRLQTDPRHRHIAKPADLYKDRKNSTGIDFSDTKILHDLQKNIHVFQDVIHTQNINHTPLDKIPALFKVARDNAKSWAATPLEKRAAILEKLGDLYEFHADELIAYLVYEGRKTLVDAHNELREAVDFCRYYAQQARIIFPENGVLLPGVTGEDNRLYHTPRGLFLCISPWNFPLAIFTGQIAAALVCGNVVIAKPAEQTPKIAARIHALFMQAGLPQNTLLMAYGDGKIGAALSAQHGIDGVAFTGSLAAAKSIAQNIAAGNMALTPLIAETGGQNAMIIDSTSLPEQVIDDVLHSAFGSAGQRCSALRVLYVQDDIADDVFKMLQGAMDEIIVGDPQNIATDIGPVIDGSAHNTLVHHKKFLEANARKIAETPLALHRADTDFYFAPCAYEIDSLDLLREEVFGPVLHVIRYKARDLENIIAEINNSGFGLTFGLHTRIESRARDIAHKIQAGNLYINRGMTGAVVGTQPFGGRGLSGTGPKAGGPHYLRAFTCEKVISVNTTANGGNAALISMKEE